jgi:PAS domain S-box-containing protein
MRGRLFLLLIIVLVPVLLVEAVIYYQRFETRKTEELQENLELARSVSLIFEAFLADIFHTQLAIGLAATASPPLSNDSLLRMLKSAEGANPALRSYSWMTPDGVNIVTTNPKIAGRKSTQPEQFSRIQAGEECAVTPVFVSSYSGDRVFTIFRGIRDDKGKVLGVVSCIVVADRLDSLMAIQRSRGAGISLIDKKGFHVYRHPRSEYTEEQRNWLKLYPVMEQVLKGGEKTVSLISKIGGETRLVAFAPISSVGWVAAASQAQSEALAGFISTLYSQALWTLLITLGGFGLALVFSRPISRSVTRLRQHALALGRGEMEKLPVDPGPGELQDLSAAFNQMAEEVRLRENVLRESELRWATTLASIGDAVIATDEAGRITFMNPVAEGLTGWTLREASMKSVVEVFNIINEESRQKVENPVAKVLEKGTIVGLANHTILVRKDGTEVPIDDSGAPLRDAGGRIMGVVLVFRDITARKQAEEALRESEERYRTLFESIEEMVTLYTVERDANGQIVERRLLDANPSFLRAAGVSSLEQLRGKTSSGVFGETWAKSHLEPIRQALATGQPRVQEVHRPEDGRHYITTVVPLTANTYLGTGRDITARKHAEEALRASEEQERARAAELAAFLDAAPTPVFVVHDADAMHITGNRAADEFLRNPRGAEASLSAPNELKPRHFKAVKDGRELGHDELPAQRAARGAEVRDFEFSLVFDDGTTREVLGYGTPLFDNRGQPCGAVHILVDITARKRAEDELRAANRELEVFNQAMVGRELRMIELKREINEVCVQLGQPPRYPLDDEKEQS